MTDKRYPMEAQQESVQALYAVSDEEVKQLLADAMRLRSKACALDTLKRLLTSCDKAGDKCVVACMSDRKDQENLTKYAECQGKRKRLALIEQSLMNGNDDTLRLIEHDDIPCIGRYLEFC